MSFYQYEDKTHICPNARSPIALAAEPRYHVVIRVGRGVAVDKHLSGFMHPQNTGVEIFGGISGDGLFEGHRLNYVVYNSLKDILYINLEGGNPDGWTGLQVTLPGGANYSCPFDTNSNCFVWPNLGGKNFSFTGTAIAMQMTPVV